MNFYIFKGTLIALYLNLAPLYTTLSFNDEIVDYIGGESGSVRIIESKNDLKTLIIALTEKRESNLTVITSKNKYVFNLRYNEKLANPVISIKDAKIDKSYKLIFKDKNYKLFEGEHSLYLSKGKESTYLNKGVPLFLKNKLIYPKRSL